jgi:hypothetical protein
MPITVSCECGRSLRVKEEYAGKRVRCPGCQAIQTVPVSEAVIPEPVTPPPAARPKAAIATEPARPKASKPRPKLLGEDANEDFGRGGERIKRERGSGSMLEKGVLGGLAMMGIAVVWCVGGLMFDVFFWYTPVLFIMGFICFIKGLIDGK